MTRSIPVKSSGVLMGRLAFGCDLLGELNEICRSHNISLGRVEAIGAVQKACIGFYDQSSRTYQYSTIDRQLEIVSLNGNVSVKDDKPFVHAHVTLADEEGKTFGGHLSPGTTVFACEFLIEVLEGPPFIRMPDAETGLPLWSL